MSRTRSMIDETVEKEINFLRDGVTFTGPSTHLASSGHKTCTDEVVKDFRKRIRNGEIINNPCSIVHESFSALDTTYHKYYSISGEPVHEYQVGEGSYFSRIRSFPCHSLARVDNKELMLANAKQKALANIDSTPYAFAEDLAEIRETLKYARSNGIRIKRLYKRFKRRDKKIRFSGHPAEVISQELAKLWLEFRFAISPLIRSIMDLFEASNDSFSGRQPELRYTSRGFERDHWNLFESTANTALDSVNTKGSRKGESEVTAGILYQITNPLSGWRFNYGLRNKDIPVTMWAVVRMSFIIDRVWNISNAIKGLTNLLDPDIHILTAWTRTKTSDTLTDELVNRIGNESITFVTSGGKRTKKYFSYIREPWKPTALDALPAGNYADIANTVETFTDIVALLKVLSKTLKS